MNRIHLLISNGGPVIFAIIGLSVLLYGRCFQLLAFLHRAYRRLCAFPAEPGADRQLLHSRQQELEEAFRQQRIPISAMIAAAPPLGLLGTVTGMIRSFGSLSAQGDQHSMDGLAKGISEVLVDTQSGLAVAIPALLLLYYAHRLLQKSINRLNVLQNQAREGS